MFRRLMNPKLILVFTLLLLLGVILVVSYTALSATNYVPPSRLGLTSQAITLIDLLPSECTMTIDNIVYCGSQGTCNGTKDNDLIFGTAGNDKIQGKQGDDCILGGGGADELSGDQGIDVCMDVPGTVFDSCESTPTP